MSISKLLSYASLGLAIILGLGLYLGRENSASVFGIYVLGLLVLLPLLIASIIFSVMNRAQKPEASHGKKIVDFVIALLLTIAIPVALITFLFSGSS